MTRRHHGTVTAVVMLASMLAPAIVSAQSSFYSKLSLTTEQAFDGNIFAAPSVISPEFLVAPISTRAPESDLFLRFGPTLEIGRVSARSRIAGHYGIEAERYLNLAGLNENIARQDALLDVRYLVTPRVELLLASSYVMTHSPTELGLASTQLALGRTQAERALIDGAVLYQFDQLNRFTVDYQISRDALSGGVLGTTNLAQAQWEYRFDDRNTFRARYRYRRIGFETQPPVGTPGAINLVIGGFTGSYDLPPNQFHLLSGGWTYRVNPLTTFLVDFGPEFSTRSLYANFAPVVRSDLTRGRPIGPVIEDKGRRPDFGVQIRRLLQRGGEVSARYSWSQETSIGDSGIFDVSRFSATGKLRPSRRITLSATPAYYHGTRPPAAHLTVYSITGEAIFDATRQLSLSIGGRIGLQRGTIVDPEARIHTGGLSIKVIVSTTRNPLVAAGGPPIRETED